MKKTYTAPTAEAIEFYMEGKVALNIMSDPNDEVIDNDTDILSNKKENPIWGEQKGGMWDNMN